MHFVENGTGETQQHHWTFESWFDYVEFGKNRVPASIHTQSSRNIEDGYTQWYMTKDFDHAVKLAEEGWSEGNKKIRVLSDALLNKVTQLIQREEVRFDVTGNDFDIALVNQGVPECWLHFENTEVQSGTGHKVIKMVYNCAASAGISTEVITARGAAACALIQALEFAGFRVEVSLWHAVSNYESGQWIIDVLLKAADQQLDIDKLAFAIMHPSTFRRFGFAVEESNALFVKTCGFDYGTPCDIPEANKGDIYFSKGHLREQQWTNPKAATDWILSELKKQGVILTEEVPA
jgi:hypothetical protein